MAAVTMAMVVKIRGDRDTAPNLCTMQKSWRLHGAGQVAYSRLLPDSSFIGLG